MRRLYEDLELEVIYFQSEDVITTSKENETDIVTPEG